MTDSKSRCVVEISTDTRPIVYLTIDRLSTDYRPTIDRLSTNYRPTIDRLSTDYRPTVDRLSTDYRPTIDRLSTDSRPTLDRLSTDSRPLCRPLCRPITRSTLPTVNKIRLALRKRLRVTRNWLLAICMCKHFSKCDMISMLCYVIRILYVCIKLIT